MKKTSDITLITDGEGQFAVLFLRFVFSWLWQADRGDSKTTLKKGVKVRIKNKGSQSKKGSGLNPLKLQIYGLKKCFW